VSTPPGPIEVHAVAADVARPLRMAVLRPDDPPERPMHAREHDPATLHVAALATGGTVLSVASVMPEPHPSDPRPGDWRLRGMATRSDVRGTGLGARVLACCEEHVLARGGSRVWCNARTPARRFYERAGYEAEGEEFEVDRIGPHFLMVKRL
jgi:predicted GNAT family N-acyltransferase